MVRDFMIPIKNFYKPTLTSGAKKNNVVTYDLP